MQNFVYPGNNLYRNLHLVALIGAGCILGILFSFFPYLDLYLIAMGIVYLFLCKIIPVDDRVFIINIFWIALLTRLLLCLAIYFSLSAMGKGGWAYGDEWGISVFAWQISDSIKKFGYPAVWRSLPTNIYIMLPAKIGDYGVSGYTYWVSFLYSLFGYVPLVSKMINTVLGSCFGVFAYLISKEIYSKKISKLSAILVSFFPSLAFWSVLNLKDTAFIFLSMFIMWLFIKSFKTKSIFYFISLGVAVALESAIRSDIWITILAFILLSYIVLLRRPLKKIIIGLFSIIFLSFTILNISYARGLLQNTIVRAMSYHIGHVHTEGISYKILPEEYYIGNPDLTKIKSMDLLKATSMAFFYFFLVPLPWDFRSKLHFIVFPQMLLWYFCLFFGLIGMLFSLRYKTKMASVVIIYIFLMLANIAIVSGNVGTTFRHRDMISPFFLIFSALGIISLCRKESTMEV